MTLIISGFPGVGKSTAFSTAANLVIKDSDSSQFDKADFPQNYIAHIKQCIDDKVDIVFVSSHKEVRDVLTENNIWYVLLYPDISLKNEYLERYKQRGSSQKFIDLVESNWENWISDCNTYGKYLPITLESGEYATDYLSKISQTCFSEVVYNNYIVTAFKGGYTISKNIGETIIPLHASYGSDIAYHNLLCAKEYLGFTVTRRNDVFNVKS